MRIVAVSDTHSLHSKVAVPDGDVLIHAGDFTGSNARQVEDLIRLNMWLCALPHRHKILVPGNHDKLLQTDPSHARALLSNATVLMDEEITIDGVRFYGSPWTPTFLQWYFMADRGKQIAAKWANIPAGIDVLVTHGPPMDILDSITRFSSALGEDVKEHLGCRDLRNRIAIVRPQAHVFGHIHNGAGETIVDGTRFFNAAICNENYRPINPPRVFDLEGRQP